MCRCALRTIAVGTIHLCCTESACKSTQSRQQEVSAAFATAYTRMRKFSRQYSLVLMQQPFCPPCAPSPCLVASSWGCLDVSMMMILCRQPFSVFSLYTYFWCYVLVTLCQQQLYAAAPPPFGAATQAVQAPASRPSPASCPSSMPAAILSSWSPFWSGARACSNITAGRGRGSNASEALSSVRSWDT